MRGLTPSKRQALKRTEGSPSDEPHSPRPPPRSENLNPATRIISTQEPGFLGSTSYNAVLAESEDQIGLNVDQGSSQPPAALSQILTSRTQSEQLKEAVSVLDSLHDFDQLERIVRRFRTRDHLSIIGPFVVQCCDAIRADIIDSGALKSDRATLAMAEKLLHNTSQKIRITKSTRFKDFLGFYSGLLIRWECLGIFFTCCGLCCNMMTCDEKELEFVGHKEADRQRLMYRLLATGNTCVGLCEEAGQLSDLGMWNMIENCVYASQVLGDAHYSVWRKVGDMSTAIFAQGLHQEGNYTSNLPFWLIQMRRHALGTAYSVDKMLCTFVGRPPRISKRYCTIVPPLDLEFHELESEGADLDRAISNIDDDGWNRSERSRKSHYQRCFVLNALIREEVLELSLGPLQEDVVEKSLDVIRRSQEFLNSLPSNIQYCEDLWLSLDSVGAFLAAQEHLDILYNEFMIRRMMVARLGDDHTELLHLAHKILDTVLESSQVRGARGGTSGCVPWIVVLYGLPSAGVLALEILQQKQSQLRSEFPPRAQAFPSGKIIQDLSVFISSLRYVHAPGDGNYALTEQARKTLQRILDRVLTIDSVGSGTNFPDGNHLPSPISNPSVLPDNNGNGAVFDLSWMENAQFDTDFWTNLPDHPLLS